MWKPAPNMARAITSCALGPSQRRYLIDDAGNNLRSQPARNGWVVLLPLLNGKFKSILSVVIGVFDKDLEHRLNAGGSGFWNLRHFPCPKSASPKKKEGTTD